MKYSYSSHAGSSGLADYNFRIQDDADNRLATSYIEDNARTVVTLMNRGLMSEDAMVLLVSIRPLLQRIGDSSGYGYFNPENPNDFWPDTECCTPEELANHKAACESWDKGEYKRQRGSEFLGDVHISRSSWGIGAYRYTDPEIAGLLEKINALLAKWKGGNS